VLSEAIRTVAVMARRQSELVLQDIPQLRVVAVRDGESPAVFHAYPPARRTGTELLGLEDLVAAVLDGEFAPRPEVYHGTGDGVVVLLDRNDRSQRVVMPLVETDRITAVHSIGEKPLTPKQAISLLRFRLSGSADHVIAAIRRVDFARRSDGKSDVRHGRETLGRSVELEIQQADQIPESFHVTLPIYLTPGLAEASTVTIEVGIEIILEEGLFRFQPLADEVEAAYHRAQVAIGDLLRSRLSDVPVFYGSPPEDKP